MSTIKIDPIDVKKISSKNSFRPIHFERVVYFQSKTTIPRGLQAVKLADISSNLRCNFPSYENLLSEFRKSAASLGGNAIVLEFVTKEPLVTDFLYKGKAAVYKLYLKDLSEDIDLRMFREATLSPPMPKTDAIRAYPTISASN